MACGGGFICGPLLSLLVLGLVRRGTSARMASTGLESSLCTISWEVEAATARVSFGVETCRTQCKMLGPHADFGYDRMFRKLFRAQRLDNKWLQCSYEDKTFELPPRPRSQEGIEEEDDQLQQCWEIYKLHVTDDHTDAGTVVHKMDLMAASKFEYGLGECDVTKCSGADGQPIPCPLEGELPSIVASRSKDAQANIGRGILNHLGKQTLNARDRAEVVQLPVPDVMQAVVSYLDGSEKTLKAMEVRNFGIHVIGATPESVDRALAEADVGEEGYTLAGFTAALANFRTHDEPESQSQATTTLLADGPPSPRTPPAAMAEPPTFEDPPVFVTPPSAVHRVHEVAAAPLAPIWTVSAASPIVFVVDLSASMRSAVVVKVKGPRGFILPSRYDLVIEEIQGILTGFQGVGFNIIAFNNFPEALFAENFVLADPNSIQIAGERLRELSPTGGTNIEAALKLAQQHCTDAKAVYLLTDGMANMGCLQYDCMPMQGHPGQSPPVPIYASYFAPGETSVEAPGARTLLQNLAQASQGSYSEPRWA